MNFPFRSPARSFAAEPADTPYRRAQQEWDARMGSAVLSARSWRTIAFGSLALAGALEFRSRPWRCRSGPSCTS